MMIGMQLRNRTHRLVDVVRKVCLRRIVCHVALGNDGETGETPSSLAGQHLISAIGSCCAPYRSVRAHSSSGSALSSILRGPSRVRLCRDARQRSYGSSRRFRDVPPPWYELP